jgi:hypothetical protein
VLVTASSTLLAEFMMSKAGIHLFFFFGGGVGVKNLHKPSPSGHHVAYEFLRPCLAPLFKLSLTSYISSSSM